MIMMMIVMMMTLHDKNYTSTLNKFRFISQIHRLIFKPSTSLVCSIAFNSDTDECLTDQHNCHPNADCINTQGSFICSCKDGYLGDGQECVGKIQF